MTSPARTTTATNQEEQSSIRSEPIEDVTDAAEKAAIIEKLTDAVVIVEGEAMRAGSPSNSANGEGRLPVGNRP